MSKARTADGYIRVCRRAGREGESFISPEVQRKKIAGWAKLHEVEIVEWWEEIDQSGAKLERPMFQEALARCERGETGGIVVARLDRFARSAVDALESIRRLNEAGARLVSVEDNFDGSTPMGRFAIGILTLIAELELERIKESWSARSAGGRARRAHLCAAPDRLWRGTSRSGWCREEPAASAVRGGVPAAGAGGLLGGAGAPSWRSSGVYPPTREQALVEGRASPGWSRTRSISGQARSGKVVKENAHEPIVTRAEFDAAQSVDQVAVQPARRVARLAGDAGRACPLRRLRAHPEDHRQHRPKDRRALPDLLLHRPLRLRPLPRPRHRPRLARSTTTSRSRCSRRSQRRGRLLAQAVARLGADRAGGARASTRPSTSSTCSSTTRNCSRCSASSKFVEGVEVRQTALDQARQALAQARQSALADELGDGDLLAAWPTLTSQEKRRLMHGLLDRVIVTRANGRGSHANPIGERTQILLRGGAEL